MKRDYLRLMSIATFFSPENLDTNTVITLDEETSKHIVQVLRVKKGEEIRLANGRGIIANAEVEDDHKKKTMVRTKNLVRYSALTRNNSIALSLLKNTSRFEWFLEKATEIGISSIIPMI